MLMPDWVSDAMEVMKHLSGANKLVLDTRRMERDTKVELVI